MFLIIILELHGTEAVSGFGYRQHLVGSIAGFGLLMEFLGYRLNISDHIILSTFFKVILILINILWPLCKMSVLLNIVH